MLIQYFQGTLCGLNRDADLKKCGLKLKITVPLYSILSTYSSVREYTRIRGSVRILITLDKLSEKCTYSSTQNSFSVNGDPFTEQLVNRFMSSIQVPLDPWFSIPHKLLIPVPTLSRHQQPPAARTRMYSALLCTILSTVSSVREHTRIRGSVGIRITYI